MVLRAGGWVWGVSGGSLRSCLLESSSDAKGALVTLRQPRSDGVGMWWHPLGVHLRGSCPESPRPKRLPGQRSPAKFLLLPSLLARTPKPGLNYNSSTQWHPAVRGLTIPVMNTTQAPPAGRRHQADADHIGNIGRYLYQIRNMLAWIMVLLGLAIAAGMVTGIVIAGHGGQGAAASCQSEGGTDSSC